MQHTALSVAQVSALCGVGERTVEQWIEEGRFSGALREHAAGKDHRHVPLSDSTALVVILSPMQGNCQTAPAEVQAQIYEVGPDTLDALRHWLDPGGEPVPASDEPPDFGDRLERLFALVTRPDGTPFTNEEIAQRAGLTDGTYVWKLRNKKWRAQDPKLSTVAALAQAFGVNPMHFFVHSDVYALLAKYRQSEGG
jgi:hypothetical protein